MRIVLSPTEWSEKLILFSQDQFNSPDKVDRDTDPIFNDESDEDDDEYEEGIEKFIKSYRAQYLMRLIQMRPLFAGLPQFEKICKNRYNHFVDSCCKKYVFEYKNKDEDEDEDEDKDEDDCEYEYIDEYQYEDVNELHEKVIDLKYIINLCGYNLTKLNVGEYPFSEIMPLINDNCPNVEELCLTFKEIKSQDFENVFCNMSHLNMLSIEWKCEYSTLPISLVESLEKVGRTLEKFFLECRSKTNVSCLPHSLASVFREFVVLKRFRLFGFEPNQPLLESIGQMQNLVSLLFSFTWKEYQMLKNKINMYPIGNLKNLEKLNINFDCGVTNEFLINLCNNAKKLDFLSIVITHVTDDGMNALNNLNESVVLDLHKPSKI